MAGGASAASAAFGAIGGIASLADLFKSGTKPLVRRGQATKLIGPFSDLLLERLTTSPEDTESFARISAALREQIGGAAEGQRQRLSDASVAGGFFDSGGRVAALQEIDRDELENFSGSIRQLLEALEQRRTAELLPFLSFAQTGQLGAESLNLQKFATDIGGLLGASEAVGSSGFSGFGG